MAHTYQLQNIFVNLEQKDILRDINLDITQGEAVALIGPNGSGKSTLLRTLAGLLTPTSGQVNYSGHNIATRDLSFLAAERAYLPARDETEANFSAKEIVLLGRYGHSHFGFSTPEDDKKAQAALERLQIEALADRRLATLSSGERQRVALARIFCQESPLLLLDEPTNFLDPTHQHLVLRELQKELGSGHTIVTAIHDLRLARRYFSKFILLDGGIIRAVLKASELTDSQLLAQVFRLPTTLLLG